MVFLADPTGKNDQKPTLRVDRAHQSTSGYILITANVQGPSKPKTLASPKHWESYSAQEQVFQEAEELRLKYVAATRAGSMMVISNRPQYLNKNLWAFFNPRIEETRRIEFVGPPEIQATTPRTIEIEQLQTIGHMRKERIARSSEPSYALGSVKSIFTALDKISFTKSSYGAEWGIAIHTMLEALMINPEITGEQFLSVTLPATELAPELWQDAIDVAQRVTRSQIWKRAMLAETKFVEMPFVLCRKDELPLGKSAVIRGVIDLVFKDSAGWTIVDYKSDRAPESRLDYMVEIYAPQLKGYCESWTAITGEKVSEAGLYFTHPDKYLVLDL